MSKAKKVISVILAIIVLVGVGFGAYLLFGKKDNELTEERAITLVGEASTKLNSAIKTMGNGMVAGTSSQTISHNLSSSGSLMEGNTNVAKDYVGFLEQLISANASIEMIDYALGLSKDDSVDFDKTYAYDSTYFSIYRDNDSVVFDLSLIIDGSNWSETKFYHYYQNTFVIIDYDKENDEPSALTCITIRSNKYNDDGEYYEDSDNAIYFNLLSVDFKTNMVNSYCLNAKASSLTKEIYDTVREKLANQTLVYDDIELYSDHLYIYTGNIADNINDINLVSHSTTSSVERLFNSYKSNVKHLDYCALNKSKLEYDKATNLTKIGKDIMDAYNASEYKYNCFVNENTLYFMSIDDYKEFDRKVITALKNIVSTLSYSDLSSGGYSYSNDDLMLEGNGGEEAFNALVTGVEKLLNYYELHKSDTNYISILLGRCSNVGIILDASVNVREGGIRQSSSLNRFEVKVVFETLEDNHFMSAFYYLENGQ